MIRQIYQQYVKRQALRIKLFQKRYFSNRMIKARQRLPMSLPGVELNEDFAEIIIHKKSLQCTRLGFNVHEMFMS